MTALRVCCALAVLVAAYPRAHATPAPLCVDVATTGAIPDDGTDDRAAIQTAISQAVATGGPHAVCFHAGTYDVTAVAGNTSFNLGNVGGVAATDLLFLGAGSSTVLRMNGDGGNQTWAMFQINNGAARIAFRDLVLDGSLATNTPSGKLIQIGTADNTQVSEISLDGVTLRASRNQAIQIAGSSTITTHLISIRSSVFQSNLGAAIDILGGCERIEISGTKFTNNTGEDVRTRGMPVDTVTVANNLIVRDPTTTATSISLQGGTSTAPNKHATVSANFLWNGSFDLTHFDNVTLSNNLLIGNPQAAAQPEMKVIGHAAGLVIDSNTVARTSTTAANVVLLDSNSSVAPTQTVFRSNSFLQPSNANIVQLQAVSDITFTNNQLTFSNSTAAMSSGVQFRALVAPTDHFVVTDNVFNGDTGGGSLASAVRLSNSSGFTIGHAIVTGNVAHGCVHGVTFDNTFTSPMTIADNLFNASGSDVVGGFAAMAVGGNRGEPVQLVGTGDPTTASVTAPNGSIYLRRDGGAHTTLYVRQSGAWVAK